VESPSDTLLFAELVDLEDIYARDFYPNAHFNFFGVQNDVCTHIISVLKVPEPYYPSITSIIDMGNSHRALVIDKNGQTEFKMNNLFFPPNRDDTTARVLEDFLNSQSQSGISFYFSPDQSLPDGILAVEEKHKRKIEAFKVAVLYVKPSQKDLMEIFQNQPPANSAFYHLLNNIAEQINLKGWKKYRGDIGVDSDQNSFYTVWEGIEIMLHIAPWMSSEQHRRLIGNDICFIIFYEDNNLSSFDPIVMDSLGTVPQVFTVIQPYKGRYRLGFFNRTNLREYTPQNPPKNYLFKVTDLKNYLFTKLHNGFSMAMS
jgi:hypothetical protein